MANEALAKRYLELGALFVAVGVDTTCWRAGGGAGGALTQEKNCPVRPASIKRPGKRSATGQP